MNYFFRNKKTNRFSEFPDWNIKSTNYARYYEKIKTVLFSRAKKTQRVNLN